MPTRSRVTILEPGSDAPLDRLGPWLMRFGAVLNSAPLWSAPVPRLADAGAGIVLLGGHHSCHDEASYPWLPAVKRLLQEAVADDVPVLGICLGHQILAEAMGGRVTVSHQAGREQGPVDIEWLPEARHDPVLERVARLGPWAVLPESHADAVVRLPRGAIELARSSTYPNQAFRIGSALGVQFHPEASPALMASWATGDPLRMRGAMRAVDTRVQRAGELIAQGLMDAVQAHAQRWGRLEAQTGVDEQAG